MDEDITKPEAADDSRNAGGGEGPGAEISGTVAAGSDVEIMKPPALDVLAPERVPSEPLSGDPLTDDEVARIQGAQKLASDQEAAGESQADDNLTPDEKLAAQDAATRQKRIAEESARAAIERAAADPAPEDQKEPVVALEGRYGEPQTSNGKDAETLVQREQRANALALLDERLADVKTHRQLMVNEFSADLTTIDRVIADMEKERTSLVDLPFGTADVGAADRKLHEAAIDPLMERVRPVVKEMAPYQ